MIFHQAQQLSDEWFKIRRGLPTASNAKRIITANGAISQGFNKYAEEIALNIEKPKFSNIHTQRGIESEDLAREIYDIESDMPKVQTADFITNDESTCGCSPDGLIWDANPMGDNKIIRGVEIKSHIEKNHIDFIEKKAFRNKYKQQVQMSILICECSSWDLVSYFNGDIHVIEWKRDDSYLLKLSKYLKVFNNLVNNIRNENK